MSSFAIASCVALFPVVVAAEPGILYVPDDDVVLTPTGDGRCSGTESSATGCSAEIDAPTVVPPFEGDLGGLVAGLQLSLDPYDVHVTQQRPPEYMAYTMLLPSVVADPLGTSPTCTTGAVSCGAVERDHIIFTSGATVHCNGPDPLHAALYAFGRVSGLEGTSSADDVMRFMPEYMMPLSSYHDACSAIEPQLGVDQRGARTRLDRECAPADHVGCATGQQNSHAELLARYGARVVDIDPPSFSDISPFDGKVFDPGEEVIVDVDISDADPVVGVRWTIVSPALVRHGIPDGTITMCTNDTCDYAWSDATPLKATASDWAVSLGRLPEGVYEVTLEASDHHGNESPVEALTFAVGFEAGGSGTTGGFGGTTGGFGGTTGGFGGTTGGWGGTTGGWGGTSGGWGGSTGGWGGTSGGWGGTSGGWGGTSGGWGGTSGGWGGTSGGWGGTTGGWGSSGSDGGWGGTSGGFGGTTGGFGGTTGGFGGTTGGFGGSGTTGGFGGTTGGFGGSDTGAGGTGTGAGGSTSNGAETGLTGSSDESGRPMGSSTGTAETTSDPGSSSDAPSDSGGPAPDGSGGASDEDTGGSDPTMAASSTGAEGSGDGGQSSDAGGCSCRTDADAPPKGWLVLLVLAWGARRRRRGRCD